MLLDDGSLSILIGTFGLARGDAVTGDIGLGFNFKVGGVGVVVGVGAGFGAGFDIVYEILDFLASGLARGRCLLLLPKLILVDGITSTSTAEVDRDFGMARCTSGTAGEAVG